MVTAEALSVVIPVHDEAESLETLHRELEAAVGGWSGGLEIVFVDDGSRDASRERLLAIAQKDPRVRVLALDAQHGQSAALDAGFRAARGELIATLDADLQNDPADLPRLLAAAEHADVVCGVRVARRDRLSRRLASRVANAFRNALTGESVRDVGCSLRVIRSGCLARVKLHRGMHRFLPTLLALEGARVIELPVAHRPRHHGRSKYGIFDRLFAGLIDVFAVRWMKSRHLDYRVTELEIASARPASEARSEPKASGGGGAGYAGAVPARPASEARSEPKASGGGGAGYAGAVPARPASEARSEPKASGGGGAGYAGAVPAGPCSSTKRR